MPRLTRVRIGAIEDLLAQLRFAPASAARRHLANAEAFAEVLDPERNYTVAELARRITGLRADPEELEDATLVGRALAGELSALIERLSHLAGLRIEELGPGAMRLSEACARWGVDRRTVERWRRQGLVGHRVIAEGRRTLAFRRESIERFERARGLSRAAPRPRRTSDSERAEIRRIAEYERSTGAGPGEALRRAARETGRSHETVRRTLRGDGGKAGRSGRTTDRERIAAARLWERGVDVREICATLRRSRASAHRIVLEGRLARIRAINLSAPESQMFSREDAADVLLAPSVVREGLSGPAWEMWDQWVKGARAQRALPEEHERAMGAALGFLRWRAAGRVRRMTASGISASGVDAAETDLRWAWWLAAALARSQRFVGLRNLEERLGAPADGLSGERARAAHEAIEAALVRAALAFDPFREGRGARLAGASTVLVTRAMHGLSERGLLEASRTGSARALGIRVEDVSWRTVGWWWLTAGPAARERAAALQGEAEQVVRWRWGLEGPDGKSLPPMTRREASERLGVGVARVARHEREWRRLNLH